ncbi:alpha/beta-Hydrolases superfamily protein [Striga hermonthica]|uniref:Alpha/beta-Hydrolases superfamily protein n=1 Tax=Striga hermonthica TaxID=68872 RepID=A0A9N7MXB1_STRHE|nr:alpha/beta-Hydrolases superfamily protein [Striga hermonthica]
MQESEITSFQYEEKFIMNSRGTKLFTCSWLPVSSEPKGLIFLCHGYFMECSVTMRDCYSLSKAGYAVYGIDYEGHGKSDGLRCYIPSFDDLVNDVVITSAAFVKRKKTRKRRGFLWGNQWVVP